MEGISHSLLITVDNGIAAVEPIQAAKAAGNVVLILDHHLPQAEIPPARRHRGPPPASGTKRV